MSKQMRGLETHFRQDWPKTTLGDAQISAALAQAIANGRLHGSNLESRGNRTSPDWLISWAFSALGWGARVLPQGLGYGLFGALGRGLGLLAPFNRRVLANLAIAFPAMERRQHRAIAAKFWRGFGHALFEMLDVDRFMRGLDTRLTLAGLPHVAAAQTAGRAVVFVHAHQASWELIFPVIERVVGPVCGIYAPGSVPALHRRILYRRTLFGAEVYPRGYAGATARVVRAIKKGRHLIIAMDQAVRAQTAPFFGQPARTSRGAIRIAKMAKADLIPVSLKRTGTGTFALTFHPALSHREETEEILAAYHRQLEGWIRQDPADWFWLHNRWKPEGHTPSKQP